MKPEEMTLEQLDAEIERMNAERRKIREEQLKLVAIRNRLRHEEQVRLKLRGARLKPADMEVIRLKPGIAEAKVSG